MNSPQIDEVLKRYRAFHVQNDMTEYGLRINRLFGLKDLIEQNSLENSVICEVGSFAGASTELFALMCKTVYSVDVADEALAGIAYVDQMHTIWNKYPNIIGIEKASLEVAPTFPDGFFDFVYLDAMHDYVSVTHDIIAWRSKIKTGGFIGGHDYINPNKFGQQVWKAVADIFGEANVKQYDDSSWIVKL
jgi:predicted O-methyltransferase YrrM